MRNGAIDQFVKGAQSPAENIFAGHVQEPDNFSVIMLLDLDHVQQTIQDLTHAFPPHFLHTFAAKANPVRRVLAEVGEHGMGVECASRGELLQALASGVAPEKIVFDSPAKTYSEIQLAVERGVSLNVDNLQELERVKEIVGKSSYDVESNKNYIGLRINPQIGQGALAGFSTGTRTSKFGIAIEDYEQEILQAMDTCPWLQMLHCHVGSQGCDFSLMTSGIRRVVDLAHTINKRTGRQQIKAIDIGGGLPVNFASDQELPSFEMYSSVLKRAAPELFDGQFKVITEFGRTIAAKSGATVMQVEYTKQSGGKNFAVVQAGTDLFIRTIYHPDKWPLRTSLLNKEGDQPAQGEPTQLYDIAGPCCLGMDIVAFDRELPEVHPGDHIILHDTGAYYHASFSYYNSRNPPVFIGFRSASDSSALKFELLCKISTVHDTVDYFGPPQ